jgi:hypothetical protein
MKSICWTASLGFDAGGDKMATVQYENGDDNDIKAGEIANLNIGVIIQNGTSDFETQFTIGWKFDSSSAENGDLSFNRYPIELLQFYKPGRFRFGGGITYQMNPSLDGSGFASDIKVDFDNALGFVLQGDFLFDLYYAGLRYTNIEYEVENYESKVGGDSVGLVLGFRF